MGILKQNLNQAFREAIATGLLVLENMYLCPIVSRK